MVDTPVTRMGSLRPVITKDTKLDPPIALNTRFRVFQSWYFGNDAGHVSHAGCVYTRTSSSGFA